MTEMVKDSGQDTDMFTVENAFATRGTRVQIPSSPPPRANILPDKTAARGHEDSLSEPRTLFHDPYLVEEWNAPDDPEDAADYLEALQTLAVLDEEELSPWEDLGY